MFGGQGVVVKGLEKSVAEEIADVSMGRPHVVLLGAGASRAAFPRGERNGKRLPVMADFFETTAVADDLISVGIPHSGRNFEELYSELTHDPAKARVREALDRAVFHYFSSLDLPDEPTLFDHLILSLRPKDIIATFNWDPFLILAARRNGHVGGVPRLLFLHGNVLEAYCEKDRVHGVRGARCSRCGQPFVPGKLLYPIAEKNYDTDPAIQSSWLAVKWAFENAFMVTFFGYGAPQSDRGAVDLLHEAWGGWQKRDMEQIEMIDIRQEDELLRTWRPFVHTHHYEVHTDFYESWIANHPRRTGEAYWSQYLDARFIENNPVPRTGSFGELWAWFEPLVAAEARATENEP
jgi:hypothetical protein